MNRLFANFRPLVFSGAALFFLALAGCLSPDYEKISSTYRQKNIQLENQNTVLQRDLTNARADNAHLREESQGRTPAIPTLPRERLNELFTVTSVELQGQCDAYSTEAEGPSDAFRVFIRPMMEDGSTLPATGAVTIEAEEYSAEKGPARLGVWHFTPADCQKAWYGLMGLSHLAFTCPWQARPTEGMVTFRLEFVDALTGKTLVHKRDVKLHVKYAATSQPASSARN